MTTDFHVRRRRLRVAACALLGIHAGLLAWSIPRQSPTYDESAHLAAGIRHWQTGAFDLDRGNPPLVGSLAAIPVLLADPQTDWHRAPDTFAVGRDFMAANGPRSFWLINLGRWACIPFSLLGGYVCFRWASEWYGGSAGLLALTLWCFSPSILAHGQVITGDMAATALGITAFYGFWKWLRRASWAQATLVGCLLGLAELAKYVWVILYLLWPALWIVWRCLHRGQLRPRRTWEEAAQGLFMLLLSVYVIHLGYLFEDGFRPLAEFHVGRRILQKVNCAINAPDWLASLPVPLPTSYVRGVDEIAKVGEAAHASYLRGQWRQGGWWYYYPYALLVKSPLGSLLLLLLACIMSLSRRYASHWKRESLLLVVPGVALLLFVSSSGTRQNMRYVLPILPLALIWAGKTGRAVTGGNRSLACLVLGCTAWSVASSLHVYPHSLSYLNELVGGPARGHEVLIDSDMDWGQDLLYLRKWLDEHPEARPLRLAYFGSTDPRLAGIEFSLPPKGPTSSAEKSQRALSGDGSESQWHALSVSVIHGYPWYIPNGRGDIAWVREGDYQYFRWLDPVARAGYSIYIYHVTPDDIDAVRRQSDLTSLP